jgi:alkylation response protein AidB-like acyl-CoA dehydrogenase
MTDGAASLLSRHLSNSSLSPSIRPVLESAFKRLTSRDPSQAWTSGQWMTERKGGSDISGTETLAKQAASPLQSTGVDGSPLGPYSISGFKWFSSATDANMAVLLARTHSGRLSAFYAPMRRMSPSDSAGVELNGITIQRLKSKLGTRAVPTAELVLNDMRGYMIGQEGDGVREISTLLNITRIHNTVIALGFWGRGLAISRAFARVRIVGGRPLIEIPAHVATMASQHVEYRGWMHLTFFTVLLLGISEQLPSSSSNPSHPSPAPGTPLSKLQPSHSDAKILLRVLTPIIKALTAKASIAGLAECMESLGGIGYLENEDMEFNIARLFRDANVLSIWEGTTDIMASDMLRVLKGKQSAEVLRVLEAWLQRVAGTQTTGLRERWWRWGMRVKGAGLEELLVEGREVMVELGRIVAGVLLFVDAERDGDEVAAEIARRWAGSAGTSTDWREKARWDRRIVFGDDGGHRVATSKL